LQPYFNPKHAFGQASDGCFLPGKRWQKKDNLEKTIDKDNKKKVKSLDIGGDQWSLLIK